MSSFSENFWGSRTCRHASTTSLAIGVYDFGGGRGGREGERRELFVHAQIATGRRGLTLFPYYFKPRVCLTACSVRARHRLHPICNNRINQSQWCCTRACHHQTKPGPETAKNRTKLGSDAHLFFLNQVTVCLKTADKDQRTEKQNYHKLSRHTSRTRVRGDTRGGPETDRRRHQATMVSVVQRGGRRQQRHLVQRDTRTR